MSTFEDLNDVAREELPAHGLERVMISAGFGIYDKGELVVARPGVRDRLEHVLVFTRIEMEECGNRVALLELLRDKLRELRRLRARLGCESSCGGAA